MLKSTPFKSVTEESQQPNASHVKMCSEDGYMTPMSLKKGDGGSFCCVCLIRWSEKKILFKSKNQVYLSSG